jgi:hypothetical protein
MTHEDPEIDSELQRGLSGLLRSHTPPAELEQRIVAELHRHGSVVPRQRPSWRRWARPAAAIALIAVGFFAGRLSAITPAPKGERYLLLLLGDASLGDRETERRFYDEYAAWAGRLTAAGHMISAARLDDARPSLVAVRGAVARSTEQPGEGVSGFFLISARDEEEAIVLARESPHLKYGGRIEIRRLVGRP